MYAKIALRKFGNLGVLALFGFAFFAYASTASAATLSFSPSSGNYSAGDTITVSLLVTSADQAINAVSGEVHFTEDLLEIVSISKTNSILTLWVQEPSFSNVTGRVDFAGVVPNPGYSGVGGTVVTMRFRARSSGTANISISSAETLANDGSGTNILQSVSGSTLHIASARAQEPKTSPRQESAEVEESELPPSGLQAPIITSVSKSVAIGEDAEILGSSIYPGATARLTLQGNSGPALITEAVVEENGVFAFTQKHTLAPGDYVGSVVIEKDGDQSSSSGFFVIKFNDEPLLSRLISFLVQPALLITYALIIVFGIGLLVGRYLLRSPGLVMHDSLHGVDVEVHKAFLKLRERINKSIEALEEESESRELTPAETRFVRDMTGTIKEAEKAIDKDIRDAEK